MKTSTGIALVAVMLMGAGCGAKVEEKAAEGMMNAELGGQGKVKVDDNTWTYQDNKTGASVSMGENVTIPEGFPKDMIIYSGAKASMVMFDPKNQQSASATFASDADQANVAKWYKEKYVAEGWTLDATFGGGGQDVYAFSKGTVKVSVSVTQGNDGDKGSMIVITRSAE